MIKILSFFSIALKIKGMAKIEGSISKKIFISYYMCFLCTDKRSHFREVFVNKKIKLNNQIH